MELLITAIRTGHLRNNKRGITLIAALMLIVFVSVSVLSVTMFITQRLSQSVSDQISQKCIYLASSGINQAIYWYRFRDLSGNGYFSQGQSSVDSNNFFVLGTTAAERLMVNTTGVYLYPSSGSSSFRYLYGLTIQNATNSQKAIIASMRVQWNNSRSLVRIRIGSLNVWSGSLSSPANCNITDVTLNTTPSTYAVTYLQFNGSMSGTTISIQFTMTDGSSKNVTVYPASQNNNFTIKSTGKTTGSNIYRTLQADYDAVTGKIVNYNEINAQIT